MGNLRLIPIVLLATASLLVLKTAGILSGSGYTLNVGGLPDARAQDAAGVTAAPDAKESRPEAASEGGSQPPRTRSWAQEMLGFPDITGSVGGAKPAPAPAAEAAKPAAPAKPGDQAKPADKGKPQSPPAQANVSPAGSLDNRPPVSGGERAVLERLQERRQELEARGRELEIREGLLKAAEKRLEARIEELKEIEAQVNAAMQKKDETEVARFKGLVTMYENMKPKDAARIFDRLEGRVLLEVAGQINPRRMSDILAQMAPEAAERITVEMAARPSTGKIATGELPKIEGRPRN